MAKISENMIPDINADWGKDASNGLPYSGEAVQEFIKKQLKNKFGYIVPDPNADRYFVFADEVSKEKYFEDPVANKELLLANFDAPSNYSARIEMISDAYNSALLGTTGNILQFKFAIEDRDENATGENVNCNITIVNQGVKKTINRVYTAQQGQEGVIIELDDYLEEGTNNVSINVKGSDTLATTTVSVVYQIINLRFEDVLDISKVYNTTDSLEIACEVEGSGNKIIDWYLDGEKLPFESIDEIPYITTYTINKVISLKGLAPGVHSIQYRLRSQVSENWFTSQTLFRNFFVSGVDETVIGVATELPIGIEPVKSNIIDTLYGMVQYVPYNIRYAIYNPEGAASNVVQIYLNNKLYNTTNISNNSENTISVISDKFGNIPIKITIDNVEYSFNTEVSVSTMNVREIEGAVLNLRSFGRDIDYNKSSNRNQWTYGDYSSTFNGFYWNTQSGWVDNTLIINSGATVSINYKPFEKDPRNIGKTIEIEFATRNVSNNDSVILDLTNGDKHGLIITASEAKLTTSDNKTVSTKFKANETNRISFVINRRESGNNAGFVFIYVNGILSGAAECDVTADIIVNKNIVFTGSSDILLKQVVIYDKPLSSDEILNNLILYRDSISEMLSIYNRNNVTNPDGQLSPDKLLNTLPVMYLTGLDENRGIPFLETQTGKAATKLNAYFDIDYKCTDETKNFTLKYARVRIQGTSSSFYPKKNYRIYSAEENETVMKDYKGNVIEGGLYSFKDGSQPVNCWCLKTDYAESSGSHNTGVAKLWNDVMKKAVIDGEHKLMTKAQTIASQFGYEYDVRTTIDGFPIVVFYRNSYNHPWQFLGKFNFNNDKSTPSVFGFCDIPGFDNRKMQCWEVLNNGHALCNFTKFDDEYFDKNWEDAFEARYDENNPRIDDLKEFCRWIYSTKDDIEKFKTEKWDHLDVYKMAAYYVYIMRFGAVDQTVKNSMFTSEDGEHFFFINYDNDTIFGVRNDGLLKHGPYIDRQSLDSEKLDSDNPYVYAGHDSVLWNNLELDDEFMEIVKVVDSALHEAGLTYSAVINMFENEQTLKWCEKVCNIDANYKYIAPPQGRVIGSLQGNRNSHRRWWVSERFNLYDAKFVTGDFKNHVVELKIVGEKIPFAKITAAKQQPYGYEILNSASLITEMLDIGDTYNFVSPEGQTLQDGDPISIYSACNIEELDLSGCMNCALKVDLSRITSPSVGNSLKRLIMNGENNALDDTTFTGTDQLTRLEYLDIQGMRALGSIDLSNSLNLKTALAKNSGLTSIKLAPGCLIERLELPVSTSTIVLEDLPLLTSKNLVLDGEWKNVRKIQISGCPEITNDFNVIWNWYNNTKHINSRVVSLHGVKWNNVDINKLIELKENVSLEITGTIRLSKVSDKSKLLHLKNLYGDDKIFNPKSELYITGPNSIYLFGPEDGTILEGDSYQCYTICFADKPYTVSYYFSSEQVRSGTTVSSTGVVSTEENGLSDSIVPVTAVMLLESGGRYTNDEYITISKRIYPDTVNIIGDSRISKEIGERIEYTWSSPTDNITGNYSVIWEFVESNLNEFVKIVNQENRSKFVIEVLNIPDTFAIDVLKLSIKKNVTQEIVASNTMTISLANPNIIMAVDTNPYVLAKLYEISNGRMQSDQYLLKDEAKLFTNEDFAWGQDSALFRDDKNLTSFNEFKYFTGITKIGVYCFRGTGLTSITLPETIMSIDRAAFENTNLASIDIPDSVTDIYFNAFHHCRNLMSINLRSNNKYFNQNDGCVYIGNSTEAKLYIIAPGLRKYIMPNNVIGVEKGEDAWEGVKNIQSIELNSIISNFTGEWFLYGAPMLTEITVPDTNPYLTVFNGCIYNKDCSKLLYCPGGLEFSSFHDNIKEIGGYAFVDHELLQELDIPESITKIGEWCFYNCAKLKTILLPSVLQSIGANCFMGCIYLEDITCLAETAPVLGTKVFGDGTLNYTGIKASQKILTIPSNATGYDSGDWYSVLQDKIGFTLNQTA